MNSEWVTVEDVPQAGQSDLYYLSYHLEGDLAVAVEDVDVTPANPLPGTAVTVAATVKNTGEAPASDVQVGFYDGDPDSGGALIGSIRTITGPLVGGGEAQVIRALDGAGHRIAARGLRPGRSEPCPGRPQPQQQHRVVVGPRARCDNQRDERPVGRTRPDHHGARSQRRRASGDEHRRRALRNGRKRPAPRHGHHSASHPGRLP